MKKEIVLMAMSGGVDSSTAAAILKEDGYDLVGVTMRVWEDPAEVEARGGTCCTLEDVEDARRVAEKLDIPHYVLNVKSEFKAKVVDYFIREYISGRTPNPCAVCNQVIKFDYLFNQGARFGAKFVATGHYAGIGQFMGHTVLLRGADPAKDQSYFLFSIDPRRLPSIIFPLGELSKETTRVMAEKYGLSVARKHESQEICFIPDNDYNRFIKNQPEGANIGGGDIVDTNGKVIGRHTGYVNYTIGQRRGLGIGSAARLYVLDIQPAANRIVVGAQDGLYHKTLLAKRINWFVPPDEIGEMELTARIRHQHRDELAMVTPGDDGDAVVEFAEPQLAITPGQGVVFYHGEVVIGGGWIEKRL